MFVGSPYLLLTLSREMNCGRAAGPQRWWEAVCNTPTAYVITYVVQPYVIP